MLNKDILIQILKIIIRFVKSSHDELNTADGKIGDGDLGITILHGLDEINKNLDKFTDDMGNEFYVILKLVKIRF